MIGDKILHDIIIVSSNIMKKIFLSTAVLLVSTVDSQKSQLCINNCQTEYNACVPVKGA